MSPARGHGIGFARTLGNGGAWPCSSRSARRRPSLELAARWELVHELLHVSFPNLPNEQSWFRRGHGHVPRAVRARARRPHRPRPRCGIGSRGACPSARRAAAPLDGATSWARVYWRAAPLFCLLADVEIRTRTRGARSLDDALRAVLAAGGNVSKALGRARGRERRRQGRPARPSSASCTAAALGAPRESERCEALDRRRRGRPRAACSRTSAWCSRTAPSPSTSPRRSLPCDARWSRAAEKSRSQPWSMRFRLPSSIAAFVASSPPTSVPRTKTWGNVGQPLHIFTARRSFHCEK